MTPIRQRKRLAHIAVECTLEVCGYTRTRGYTRPDPYPRHMVAVLGLCPFHGYGSGWVDALRVRVYPLLPVKKKKFAVENQETLHLVIPTLHELKTKMLKQEIQYKQDSPEISQLCRDLAKSVGENCWAKLTWYHFAAAFLHLVYTEHDSLKSNSMEQELDRIRLEMKGMVASLEDKALGAPPK